jgi:hypothetical protein
MRALTCLAFALAVILPASAQPAPEEAAPAYTAELTRLPPAARQHIFQASDVLRKRATRILRDGKPVLDVWLPTHVPFPNGLFDGILLAILAPPQSPDAASMVTVRAMEKGMRVDFATVEREDAHRTVLRIRRPLNTWRRFDETRPLALVGPEEPAWQELPANGPRAALQEVAGELYLTLALLPDQRRGVRWQIPPRIRKILAL